MWQAESYTIEIRNTDSCDSDSNIVLVKTLNAEDLEEGHNTVEMTGLCPSMQYWYCAKTVWVHKLYGQETERRTIQDTGTFITAGINEETGEWDQPVGPCAGTPSPA